DDGLAQGRTGRVVAVQVDGVEIPRGPHVEQHLARSHLAGDGSPLSDGQFLQSEGAGAPAADVLHEGHLPPSVPLPRPAPPWPPPPRRWFAPGPHRRGPRSEERRVGKEARTTCTPYTITQSS